MNTRFVAGGISGAALIFALFFLKESNPVILAKQRGETVEQKKEEKKPRVKVHLTLTMVLCFVFEFCVRWGVNIYTARYGIYLNDKFGTPSSVLSCSRSLSSLPSPLERSSCAARCGTSSSSWCCIRSSSRSSTRRCRGCPSSVCWSMRAVRSSWRRTTSTCPCSPPSCSGSATASARPPPPPF